MVLLSKTICLNRFPKSLLNNLHFIRRYVQFTPIRYTPERPTQPRTKSIFKIFQKPTPATYKIKDEMPEKIELIYRNSMETYLTIAQLSSVVCVSLVALLILIDPNLSDYELVLQWERIEPKSVKNEIYVYIVCLVAMASSLTYMVSKMPLRIYNFPTSNKYIFVFNGTLPFSRKKVVSHSKHIVKMQQTGFLPWNNSRYEIEGHAGIVLVENFFRNSADLNIMLGYQRRAT